MLCLLCKIIPILYSQPYVYFSLRQYIFYWNVEGVLHTNLPIALAVVLFSLTLLYFIDNIYIYTYIIYNINKI